jgi:hypothetical protein
MAFVAPDTTVPLTPDGWGDLRIGMTRAEVVAMIGDDADPDAVGGPYPEECDEFRPERAPEHLLVMIEDGRLSRISISGRTGIRTGRGFAVGDAAAVIRTSYSTQAVATPHYYWAAPAEYLTVWSVEPPQPNARGIVYEIGTDGRVSGILAGNASIEFVEGCV